MEEVVSKGKTRCTVVLRSDVQVDLRVVAEVCYGAALHYFTGSKSHNIAVRKILVKQDLKLNEYVVFRDDDRIAGRTEEKVFEQAGLRYIKPELRESRGEIEAAKHDELPDLVALDDIRGNLHAHTTATDGKHSLKEMAKAARGRGDEYLAITDHTKNLAMAKEMGIKTAVSTDAHTTSESEFMRFGVNQARRGWLESDDVINTRSWTDLKKLLNRD